MLILLILLAITGSILGCFVLWNRVVNYFDSFAHSAFLAYAISYALHADSTLTLLAFSAVFACSLGVMGAYGISLSNVSLLLLTSAFVSAAVLVSGNHDHHCNHEHQGLSQLFLEGSGVQDISVSLVASVVLLIFVVYRTNHWIAHLIDYQSKKWGTKQKIEHFGMLMSISLFAALSMQFLGLAFLAPTSILPAIIACRFATSPLKAIAISALISLSAVLFGEVAVQGHAHGGLAGARMTILELGLLALATWGRSYSRRKTLVRMRDPISMRN